MGLPVPAVVKVDPKLKLVMVSDTGSRLQRSWTTFVLPPSSSHFLVVPRICAKKAQRLRAQEVRRS
jgi:hypothetical protein